MQFSGRTPRQRVLTTLVIIPFFLKKLYILTKGKENRFLAILFLDYMDVFMFVNVLELYKIIHYLIQWLYAGTRETNVIYHYSNIDPCETIKVHDYMYAKRMNQ